MGLCAACYVPCLKGDIMQGSDRRYVPVYVPLYVPVYVPPYFSESLTQ